MAREVEYTDEFGDWWTEPKDVHQDRVAATVQLLAMHGPALPFPHASGISGSRNSHMGIARSKWW